MFDAVRTAFLESGCALIVGTTGPDGEPYAARAWGLTLAPDHRGARILLDADDVVTVGHAATGGAIAVTAASVVTLQSLQLKGRALGVEAATIEDGARAGRFCEAFFADIAATDGTDRSLCERLVPAGYVACTVAIDDVFDQTPGPGAGAAVGVGGP